MSQALCKDKMETVLPLKELTFNQERQHALMLEDLSYRAARDLGGHFTDKELKAREVKGLYHPGKYQQQNWNPGP